MKNRKMRSNQKMMANTDKLGMNDSECSKKNNRMQDMDDEM